MQTSNQPTITIPENWHVRGFEDAMKAENQRPPWIIEDLLMAESATLLSAQPHCMKSLSWLQACLEAPLYKHVWGHFKAPDVRRTLFIETEDPAWLVESRIRGFAKGLGLSKDHKVEGFQYFCPGPFPLVKHAEQLQEVIRQHKPDFVVLSTLQALLDGADWINQKDMAAPMATIVKLSRQCPLVVVTHSPWDAKKKRAAGTVTQAANFLTTIHYDKNVVSNDEQYVNVSVDSKAGASETDFSLRLYIDSALDPKNPENVRKVQFCGKSHIQKEPSKKEQIKQILKANPDATTKEITAQVGCVKKYVDNIRKELLANGTKDGTSVN